MVRKKRGNLKKIDDEVRGSKDEELTPFKLLKKTRMVFKLTLEILNGAKNNVEKQVAFQLYNNFVQESQERMLKYGQKFSLEKTEVVGRISSEINEKYLPEDYRALDDEVEHLRHQLMKAFASERVAIKKERKDKLRKKRRIKNRVKL